MLDPLLDGALSVLGGYRVPSFQVIANWTKLTPTGTVTLLLLLVKVLQFLLF